MRNPGISPEQFKLFLVAKLQEWKGKQRTSALDILRHRIEKEDVKQAQEAFKREMEKATQEAKEVLEQTKKEAQRAASKARAAEDAAEDARRREKAADMDARDASMAASRANMYALSAITSGPRR